MNTPDLTLEDLAGSTSAGGILVYTSNSESEWVQLAGVIFAGLTALAVIAAGAWRRGKRAENLAEATLYTGIAPETEEE